MKTTVRSNEAPLLWGCLASSTAALITYAVWRQRTTRECPFANFDCLVPGAHWFRGHADLLTSLQGHRELCVEHADKKTSLSCFFTFHKPTVSFTQWKLAERILKATHIRQNSGFLMYHFRRLFGSFSLVMENENWKERRKLTNKLLVGISERVPAIAKRRVREVCVADDSENRDLLGFCRNLALQTFGDSLGLHNISGVKQHLEFLQAEASRRCSSWRLSDLLYWLPTDRNRRYRSSEQAVRAILLEQSIAFPERLSDSQKTDTLKTLLFGGYDSTSLGLFYTLFLLHKHNLQDRARQSVDFTRLCVLEALRFYPPVIATARSLHKDLEIAGHTIQKGTRCFLSMYWIHHSAYNFEDPDSYLPERWLSAGKSCPEILSFSAGARNCPGRSIAMEIIVALTYEILQKFDLELPDCPSELILVRRATSMAPYNAIPVLLRPRS